MVLLWNTTGNIESLEGFRSVASYSISIFIKEPSTQDIIFSKSFVDVQSTKTPLIQIIPSTFKLFNTNINLEITDNTNYTYQDPLQLYVKLNDRDVPYPIYFSSKQAINNTNMRSVELNNIPYNNITIFFKNI